MGKCGKETGGGGGGGCLGRMSSLVMRRYGEMRLLRLLMGLPGWV